MPDYSKISCFEYLNRNVEQSYIMQEDGWFGYCFYIYTNNPNWLKINGNYVFNAHAGGVTVNGPESVPFGIIPVEKNDVITIRCGTTTFNTLERTNCSFFYFMPNKK